MGDAHITADHPEADNAPNTTTNPSDLSVNEPVGDATPKPEAPADPSLAKQRGFRFGNVFSKVASAAGTVGTVAA